MTTTATKARKLRPRHRRVEVPRFEITERDLTALRQIWRYRLIATPELIALIALEHSVGESERWIKNRLQLLYHGRFVDRLPVPLHHPDVYALGTRGATLLEARFGIMRPRTGWRDRSEEQSYAGNWVMTR